MENKKRLTDDEITALCEKYKRVHRLTVAVNGHHVNEVGAYEHGLKTSRVFRSVSVPQDIEFVKISTNQKRIKWTDQDKNYGLDYSSSEGVFIDYAFDIRYDCTERKEKPDCGLVLTIRKGKSRLDVETKFGTTQEELKNYAEKWLDRELDMLVDQVRSYLAYKSFKKGQQSILYKHTSSGNVYTFVEKGMMKFNGEWADGISYRNEKGRLFTRTFADFHSKFTIIP